MTTMKQRYSSSDLLSKFFKVYLPGESGDDLELPISFNGFLANSLPRSVTVRSIYGKIWKMALRKSCVDAGKYALVDGWKRIVTDEDINGGDFLEFEFDGSGCFNFCIYDRRTMCKRLRISSIQSNDIKIESDSDDFIVLDDDDDTDVDDAAHMAVDDDVEYVDTQSDDDDDDVDDDVETVDTESDNDNDDDGRQYLDDRENPSFTVTLNPKKKSQLRIPAHVIKDYGLNFPENITLVDPLAKKFGTLEKKIKIQTNGSVFIKGFGSVIRRNKVKTTDKMIFEVKKTGSNLVHTIKVSIISK